MKLNVAYINLQYIPYRSRRPGLSFPLPANEPVWSKMRTPMVPNAQDVGGDLLRQVVERLPRFEPVLATAFEGSEAFRTLCEEYLLCAEAVERWRDSEAPAAANRSREYQETLVDLEREIEEWLEHADRGPALRGGEPGGER